MCHTARLFLTGWIAACLSSYALGQETGKQYAAGKIKYSPQQPAQNIEPATAPPEKPQKRDASLRPRAFFPDDEREVDVVAEPTPPKSKPKDVSAITAAVREMTPLPPNVEKKPSLRGKEDWLRIYTRKRNYCNYQIPGGGILDLRTVYDVHTTLVGPKHKLIILLKEEGQQIEVPGTAHETARRERLIVQYLDKCEESMDNAATH